MATAAETTSIIELVVGMVDAAPGADILAELEALLDGGMTIEEMAVAITENPAWSGDTGLFPDFLPNAIFAKNYLTQLIGSEVTKEVLDAAVGRMTGGLNAGTSRGVAINDAIVDLAASTNPDFADAALALANKTAVAEYYSVELGESSDDLDVLISIVSGVDSDADAIADGEAAADAVIANLQPLQLLINNLGAANDAVKAFLGAADGDSSSATFATETDVNITDPAGTQTALSGIIDDYGDDTIGDVGDVQNIATGADYDEASPNIKNAIITDQLLANAAVGKTLATAVSTTGGTTSGIGSVTGLASAVGVYTAALASQAAATSAANITQLNLTAAEGIYGESDETVTDVGRGTAFITASGDLIIGLTTAGTFIEIKPGFSEATNLGITALFAAAAANFGAVYGIKAGADRAVVAANKTVANLDLIVGNDKEVALNAMAAAMVLRDVVVPALTNRPTVTEIKLEQDGLEDALEVLEDALGDIEHNDTTTSDDDAAVLAAVIAALKAAETAGTITNAQNLAALGTFTDDGIDDDDFANSAFLAGEIAKVVGALNSATGSLFFDFDALVTKYEGEVAINPDMETPLTRAYLDALKAARKHAMEDADFAAAIAARDTAETAVDDLEVLTDARDDAEDAFGDGGFAVPVTLGSIATGTSADDVFLANGVDSQILGFGDDDQLFLGDVDLVLNANTAPRAEGDNDVLEYWITGTTNAVITIETSEFGSAAFKPEIFAITLTGVAAADVSVTDGILTIG